MKLSSVQTNLNAAEDGIWFPMGEGKARLKIAKWGNQHHQSILKDLAKKHGKQVEFDVISDDQAAHILAVQWPAIVTDIEGITEDDGTTPIAYSQQLIIDIARNPEYKDFFKKIERISKDEANYLKENIKALGESLPNS